MPEEITAAMWARCLREHIERRLLAPPGECPLCDNARRSRDNEPVNVQEAMS